MQFPPEKYNRPYFKLRKRLAPAVLAAVPSATWTVPALCAAYKWPTGLGGGGVIAIVELGGGWVASDMSSFFESIGQPVPQITDVSVDGTQNNPNQNVGSAEDADYEVGLDIQVSAAAYYAATGKPASIRMYWSQDIASAVESGLRRLRCMLHLLGLR